METITVAAERINPSYTTSMAVLVGIGLVIVAVVWMVLAKRDRQPPRA